MTARKYKYLLSIAAIVLVLGSFLINIKNIFTSCQIDAEYQVTMAYRLLQGDKMFSQMWEPHQTSAFFLAFFEWIFLKITKSTAGILVYANVIGIFCRTMVGFCVYMTFRRFSDRAAAVASLLFVLNANPKDVVLPDFANMQVWFGLLLMCCLICYFELRRLYWLILGAGCLCLQVLSYPSCILIWLPCVILIGMYSGKKGRDLSVFTGVCGIGGLVWLLYFMRGKPGKFLEYIYYIWSGDESHAVGLDYKFARLGEDLFSMALDMRYILLPIAGAALAGWISRNYFRRKGKVLGKRESLYTGFCWFLAFYILGYLLHLPGEQMQTKYHFFILYIIIEVVCWYGRKYLNALENRIFVVGQAIGLGGFLATWILSDSGVFTSLPYMIPSMCTCLLPLLRLGRDEETAEIKSTGTGLEESRGEYTPWKQYIAIGLFCMVMIFRNMIYLNGWMMVPENFRQDSILGVKWTIRDGPLKGIVNGDGAYVADASYWEWQNFIRDGDKVLVISYPTLTATVYLYKEMEICTDSTISTPTYSERMLKYWEENPEKYPNVVAVKYYDGSVLAGEYNRVLQWLEEDFPAKRVENGTFWRFYYLDD